MRTSITGMSINDPSATEHYAARVVVPWAGAVEIEWIDTGFRNEHINPLEGIPALSVRVSRFQR